MRSGRLGLSAIDKCEIWSRWKAGQTLHEIGRVYGKCHNTIRAVLLPRGGIPPVARRRSRLALTFAEREDISRGMASGSSIREIASCLHRAASTVSREITRHGGRPAYRAYDADQQAWNAGLRPKRCLLAVNSKLRDLVASKLILDWSPEQISGWLKSQYPDDESMRVSHETIYRSLFIQARGALRKELLEHLRSKRRMRRSRHASEHGHSRGQIVEAISIRERPAEAEDRAIPGHWEGDLLAGWLATMRSFRNRSGLKPLQMIPILKRSITQSDTCSMSPARAPEIICWCRVSIQPQSSWTICSRTRNKVSDQRALSSFV